jgi:hypothetical protein
MDADMGFSLFLGIVGLVVGAMVVWFLLAEHPFEGPEVRGGPVDQLEAPMLVELMAQEGMPVDEAAVSRLLELHAAYFDGTIHETVADAEMARLEQERARTISEMARRDVA